MRSTTVLRIQNVAPFVNYFFFVRFRSGQRNVLESVGKRRKLSFSSPPNTVVLLIWKTFTMAAKKIRRVAVIGAGSAGAITTDALVKEQAFDTIRVFERQDVAGGTW